MSNFVEFWIKTQGFDLSAFPKFLEHWTKLAAGTAPVWRMVTLPGFYNPIALGGTSWAATASGLGAAAAGAIPVIAMVGVWVSLGSGYYEARQIAKREAALSGFSHGFVAGVLGWTWPQLVARFGKWSAGRNVVDQAIAVGEAEGYNKGLKAGFGFGNAAPAEAKKTYRILLRKLSGVHPSGPWSSDPNEAYLQQRNYVLDLAAAGRKHGVIQAE